MGYGDKTAFSRGKLSGTGAGQRRTRSPQVLAYKLVMMSGFFHGFRRSEHKCIILIHIVLSLSACFSFSVFLPLPSVFSLAFLERACPCAFVHRCPRLFQLPTRESLPCSPLPACRSMLLQDKYDRESIS